MHFYKITSYKISAPYTLWIQFDDGLERTIDFSSILYGELYEPLRDLTLFNQVKIDPEVFTLVWPNGADFDPKVLHDWPDHLPMWLKQVKHWKASKYSEASTKIDTRHSIHHTF